jgi:CheY-like chemotaxis protein
MTEEDASARRSDEWHAQVERELSSLHSQAQRQDCNVRQALANAIEFTAPLLGESGVRASVESAQTGLVASLHPVVLEQVLVSGLKRMGQIVGDGGIAIYARQEDGNVKITLTGSVSEDRAAERTSLLQLFKDIGLGASVSVEVCLDSGRLYVWIQAPSVGKATVLIVDDNEDMARFYRSCAVGSRYQILHRAHGSGLVEAVANTRPDIVVLDVMLPDIDGWRLLMRLHEDQATRDIPVVVCSVVKEADLASSLGAARFLEKPVRPREFIRALDEVLS